MSRKINFWKYDDIFEYNAHANTVGVVAEVREWLEAVLKRDDWTVENNGSYLGDTELIFRSDRSWFLFKMAWL